MIADRLPADFPDALRSYGIIVHEVPGWRDRVSSSTPWRADAWALHHDAGPQADPAVAGSVGHWIDLHTHLLKGYVIYQGGIDILGRLHLWGGGRSANAGNVDGHWYDLVLSGGLAAERPALGPLVGGRRQPIGEELNSTGFLGGFMLNGGANAANNFTSYQVTTATRLGDCLVSEYGYRPTQLLEHRQWAGYRGKPDPSWGDRNWTRLVEAALEEGDDMALADVEAKLDSLLKIWLDPQGRQAPTAPGGRSALSNAVLGTATKQALAALAEDVADLRTAVDRLEEAIEAIDGGQGYTLEQLAKAVNDDAARRMKA